MNITELARKLKTSTQELREKIPQLGFDVGEKAIQVDDKIAEKIIQVWKDYQEQEKLKSISQKIEIQDQLKEKKAEAKADQPPVSLPKVITVNDLADRLNLSVVKVISELMRNGIMATINDNIDFETAAIIVEDLGFRVTEQSLEEKKIRKINAKDLIAQHLDQNLSSKTPVVTIMGHIDHGKTTLLDAIRKTHVTQSEQGGITQHISAYQVEKKNKLITFIDTPGHAAFKKMRSRGGTIADIAILIVAAEEGLKPQTMESIKIIQEENLMMLVAINKVDKPEANVDQVKKQLSEINLTPEDWGGKTICVPISAKTGQGIDDLLDMILLIVDMEKEKIMADPNGPVLGTIIEAHLDKNEGPQAIVLIQSGTLKKNDIVLVNQGSGKIKSLKLTNGQEIEQALPGTPVKILGLKNTPQAGDILEKIDDKKDLKKRKKIKQQETFEQILSIKNKTTEESSDRINLNLVLKADVMGSLEAVEEAINKLEHPKIKINIIKRGLGQINETDILRAEVKHGHVFGFNTQISTSADLLAKNKNIPVKNFGIIYELIDEIKDCMNKLIQPEFKTIETGQLKVLKIFRQEAKQTILGGQVVSGKIEKGNRCLILRDQKEIGLGKVSKIQKSQQDIPQANAGEECGLQFEGKTQIQPDDILRAFKEVEQEKNTIQ
ncbi:MAG: translation initiation factor IF-2 [Patescibacteria group bacterium]|nr:translation initiation factor IF-2 [Patescibacteria group bacterium]